MVATTGYQAGFESSQSVLSYAFETVWGVLPAVQFQAIRYMSESLAATKQRDRPAEITTVPEAMQAITTRVSAGGDIKVAFSYGTHDAFIAGAINAEWPAAATIVSITTDVTFTTAGKVLSSSLASKFNALVVGQYIRLTGFTNAVNNDIWRVSAKASGQNITLEGPGTPITEVSAGANVVIKYSMIRNGSTFKSLFIEQAFSSNVFLTYAGSYVSGMNIAGGVGQFINGSFTVMAKQELDVTAEQSTGAVLAAPTGPVMDPVGAFKGIRINGANIVGILDSFSVTTAAEGAQMEYGMGNAAAAGVALGTLKVTGMAKLYFASLTLYDTFKNETAQRVAIIIGDANGNAYVISGQVVYFMNPKVEVTGPGSPVMVTYDLEFNPSPNAGEGTIQIDRLAA